MTEESGRQAPANARLALVYMIQADYTGENQGSREVHTGLHKRKGTLTGRSDTRVMPLEQETKPLIRVKLKSQDIH